MMRYLLTLLGCVATMASIARADTAVWPRAIQRPWIGPAFWANPMMDWRLAEGRVECHTSGLDHDLHWMTHQLKPGSGTLRMTSRLGFLPHSGGEAFMGFKFAIAGHDPGNYRANLIRSRGIRAGVMADGRLLIGRARSRERVSADDLRDMRLSLESVCVGERAECRLEVHRGVDNSARPLVTFQHTVRQTPLRGNLALACEQLGQQDGQARGWFGSWHIDGSKVDVHAERTFGPVLWTQYTLSQRRLKLMAHLAPVGRQARRQVLLQLNRGDTWVDAQTVSVDPLSRTALFRLEDWDDSRSVRYRVRYQVDDAPGRQPSDWEGIIRQNPKDREQVALGVFTGLGDAAFPNTDLVATVAKHNPDMLYFSGDQVYERNGGYGPVANSRLEDVPRATLNYLPKFWLWGWTFRDLLRDRPAIVTTDDHDVYSNDLWGRGGIQMPGNRCTGGYSGHPDWVNMAERTQMGHLPDPVDPAPIKNGIRVYFTQVKYGSVGFAVLEDRKFKSAPSEILQTPIGHGQMDNLESIESEDFTASDLDRPGLRLLGERQLAFLQNWKDDWQGIQMKAVLSASSFACSHHAYGNMVADLDSNGWPQSARDKALRLIRDNHAVMAHGDLHLAVLLQHGIDRFRDGPWSYSCPSSAATTRRVWQPERPGSNRQPGEAAELGDHFDGLGNRMTIWGVANPDSPFEKSYRPHDGSILDDPRLAGSGFGILRFNKPELSVTFESWPIYDVETRRAEHRQHPSWPRTVSVGGNRASGSSKNEGSTP